MKFQFFSVPVHDPGPAQDELNRFLATHRVLAVDRQLVVDGARSTWAVCVHYSDGPTPVSAAPFSRRGKMVDYREVLREDEFAAPSPGTASRASPTVGEAGDGDAES